MNSTICTLNQNLSVMQSIGSHFVLLTAGVEVGNWRKKTSIKMYANTNLFKCCLITSLSESEC